MAEQRGRRGPAPAEELEDLRGGPGAAHAHDGVRVEAAELRDALLVGEARLVVG